MLLRLLVASVAGVVLSLAYEPVAIAYLMPLALAAYALTTRDLRARAGFAVGLAFGVGFYFVHIWWMKGSIGVEAWVALAGIEALFYGLLGALATALHRLGAWPAWLAAAWTTMEMLRSEWPFSGMPWGRLGFGVVDTPLAPALAYVGVNGTSFVIAAIGFLIARLIITPRGDQRLLTGVAVVGVSAVAVLPTLVPWTLETTGESTVAAVQGNVPGRGDDVLVDPEQLTTNHVDATVGLAEDVAAGTVPQPDFVVWPENSTARDPFSDAGVNSDIRTAVEAIGVPIMVGAIVDAGPDNVLNQGIVWDPETGAGERYTKRHPVAYGEYIPLRGLLEKTGITKRGQLARIPRDMLSGTRNEPLTVAGVEVADAICFDIAYDDGLVAQLEGGAELLTVQTSNASFIFTDQIEQQFAITRARAIESGRYVVVATTNGVAGVIAPDGSVLDRTERRTQDVVVETIELKGGMTPGVRVSWSLRVIAPALTLLGLVLALGPLRRRAGGAPVVEPAEPTTSPSRIAHV